jgi:hypothetical protein
MSQSIKDELIQTLERLSLDKLLTVLHFARSIEQQTTEQVAASAEGSAVDAERALADFLAAAGYGGSGDAKSSQHIDEVLYGRQGIP